MHHISVVFHPIIMACCVINFGNTTVTIIFIVIIISVGNVN
jgi:hypothetical protein